MRFSLESEVALGQTQLDAIHYLERRLDRAHPRYAFHVGYDGITIVVVPVAGGVALTAIWRFRGDAQALTVAGDDWHHVFSSFAGDLCKIFKVRSFPLGD